MASITSATSGPSTDPATWAGGVVPVLGDKVTIAHPGTNTLIGTQYLTNTAGYAIGATSITLTAGSGSVVAGECVQFGADPAYYKVATGITGPGVLVLASPGLTTAIPAAAVQIVNRGHVVELVATHAWGDDTSSLTAASNGVVVLGTLKASRTVSSILTARGTVFMATGGTIDYGLTAVDPIPAAVGATLLLNDSAALVSGKHGLANTAQQGTTLRMAGVVRTRNTRLTTAITAGATSITVDGSTGWSVGDRLVIASDTDDPSRAQVVSISAGASPTWTVGAVTNARSSGCRVGNLSSNVAVKSASSTFPGFVTFNPSNVDATGVLAISDVRFEDGGSTSGWVTVQGIVVNQAALCVSSSSGPKCTVLRAAFEATTGIGARALALGNASLNRHAVMDAAIYGLSAVNQIQLHSGANMDLDAVVYRTGASSTAVTSNNSDGSAGTVLSGVYWGAGQTVSFGPSVGMTFSAAELKSPVGIFAAGNGTVDLNGCSISAPTLVSGVNAGTKAVISYSNCTFTTAALAGPLVTANRPSQEGKSRLTNVNGSATDHRVLSYYCLATTDTTTRKRSTYAVKIRPMVASLPITYTFTLPAVAGVAQTIKGALRFDATYGTATPPSIALSGQGVAQSFTAPAVADAWHDFTLTFTPTSTGDITATVTVQSTSTAGFAWLDGVYHYPMTQAVRHFGYLWQPQSAQVVDSRITLSEAAALALPVSVNHGTSTITVSGACTARQVFEACMADLCQTANQGTAVHISSSTGDTFATPYTVSFTGSGAITGAYTDAAGLHVTATATLPASGCRVQLYDVTNAVELDNIVVSGTAYAYPLTYSSARTLRLRVAYQAGLAAKIPQEVTAVLSASGASFLVPDVSDTVYASNAVDGSTCSEFSPDYPNLQIDLSDGDGTTSVQRVYAWARFAGMDAQGIRLMHNAVQALDASNYMIDVNVVNARFDNTLTAPVLIVGGYIRRSDGSTVIAAASNSIQMDPGRAYMAPTAGATIAAAVRYDQAIELANATKVAALHGIGAALVVTPTSRTAGSVHQTIETVGDTVTVTAA